MSYVDAHSHLADPRLRPQIQQVLRRAQGLGITHFLQGGVGPEDWDLQIELKKQYPEILTCFGLHPYWVADHKQDECEEALDQLARILPQASALGEAGLDFRPQISKNSENRQIDIFEKQIELAKAAHLPLVLHLVRAHEEAIKILDLWSLPERGAMVHSFNGSIKQAEDFLKLGCHISVGGPVCRPDNQRLHQAIAAIPLEKLFLETDSPDQPPPGIPSGGNEPQTLIQVAEAVARIRKMTKEEVLTQTSQNVRLWLKI